MTGHDDDHGSALGETELDRRRDACARATSHGEPIVLGREERAGVGR